MNTTVIANDTDPIQVIEVFEGSPGEQGPPGAPGPPGIPGPGGVLTHLGSYRFNDPLVMLTPAQPSITILQLTGPATAGAVSMEVLFYDSTGALLPRAPVTVEFNQDAAALQAEILASLFPLSFTVTVTGTTLDTNVLQIEHTGDVVFTITDPTGSLDGGATITPFPSPVGAPPSFPGVHLVTLGTNAILEAAYGLVEEEWQSKTGPTLILATAPLDLFDSASELPESPNLEWPPPSGNHIEFRSVPEGSRALRGMGGPLLMHVQPGDNTATRGTVHIFGRVSTWEALPS
jgi:hypothetical protein